MVLFLVKDAKDLIAILKLLGISEFKYLGAIISSTTVESKSVDYAIKNANFASGTVISIETAAKHISWNPSVKLFESMITSSLLDAFPIWGLSYVDELDTVHMNHFKRLLKVIKNTPNYANRLKLTFNKINKKAMKWSIR